MYTFTFDTQDHLYQILETFVGKLLAKIGMETIRECHTD